MKQEDLNELLSKHPSPEAAIQHSERRREATERQCACCDSPSYWDSDCFFNDHRTPKHSNPLKDKTMMFISDVKILLESAGINVEIDE